MESCILAFRVQEQRFDGKQKISSIAKYHMVKSGLVLEGGGMRGIYTAGILDVLGEHGVGFDEVVGVSAGAIHAASFLAGQHGRSIRYYLAFCRDPRFMGIRSLFGTGDFVNYGFCYHSIPEKLVPLDYEHFEKCGSEFYAVATNVERGCAEYLRVESLRGKGMEAIRASASLPLVSKMVHYEGMKLLDGGTSDSIPFEFMRSRVGNKCVVVLTQVKGYKKRPEMNRLYRLLYRKYPEYLRTVETRYKRYNSDIETIERLEARGELFVFRPSEFVHVHRLERDPAKILAMYELGRRDAMERLLSLREFLALELPSRVSAFEHESVLRDGKPL